MVKPRAGPPAVRDFSQGAVQKAVLTSALSNSLTIYPTALAIPLFLGLVATGWLPCLFAGIGCLGLGAGTFIVNYFLRNESVSHAYIQKLLDEYARQKEKKLNNLKNDLERYSRGSGRVAELAQSALDQLEGAKVKFENVREMLLKKFNPEELSFRRYLAATEQAFLGVLSDLNSMLGLLESASSINPESTREKIRRLQKGSPRQTELETQLQLWEEQLKNAETILARNESALTAMERVSCELACLDTDRLSVVDTESAIRDLHDLASRTQSLNSR
ncbi:MAG: hypothetical protein KJ749_05000 [Planctomycetes bacterium]|nr:hypothetical protein [Planctomycetota bacterium]